MDIQDSKVENYLVKNSVRKLKTIGSKHFVFSVCKVSTQWFSEQSLYIPKIKKSQILQPMCFFLSLKQLIQCFILFFLWRGVIFNINIWWLFFTQIHTNSLIPNLYDHFLYRSFQHFVGLCRGQRRFLGRWIVKVAMLIFVLVIIDGCGSALNIVEIKCI